MEASVEIKDLYAALSRAQGAFPAIPKNQEVEVKNKEGTRVLYKFKYADLTQIIDSTRPELSKNELSFTQSLGHFPELGLCFYTKIMHGSGQWEKTGVIPVSIGQHASMKDIAGMATYGKRLSLSAALGISADEDMDAPSENDEMVNRKSITGKNKTQERLVNATEAIKSAHTSAATKEDTIKLLKAFEKFNVSTKQIFEYLNKPTDQPLLVGDIEVLRDIWRNISGGQVKAEEFFGVKKAAI